MSAAWEALKQKMIVAGGTAVVWGEQTVGAVSTVLGWLDKLGGWVMPPAWGASMLSLGKSIYDNWRDPLQNVLDVNNNLQQATLGLHPKVAAALEPVKLSLQEEAKILDDLSKGPLAAITKADADWAALLDRMQPTLVSHQAVIDSIDGSTLEAAKAYLALGRSVQDVGTYLGLNKAQMEEIVLLRKADVDAIAVQKKAGEQQVKDVESMQTEMLKKQKEYDDLVRKGSTDTVTFQIENMWRAADEEIAAYTKRYGYSAQYADLIYTLTAAQVDVVARGYDKMASDAEAAAQRQINAALMTAAAWEKAALAGQIEGVTIVGARPGEPGSELKTSGFGPAGPAGPSGKLATGGPNDARIASLLSQGYTYGEAAAIASGTGGMIIQPTQSRGFSAGVSTTININGSVLGDKDQIAKVVGDSLTDALRRAGYTVPGR